MIDVESLGDGRYNGDLAAVLQHNPAEAKYPFRVVVADWREGGAWGDKGAWYSPNPILHRFDPVKHFRRLKPAVRYLSTVLEAADLGYYERQVGQARNEGFVNL